MGSPNLLLHAFLVQRHAFLLTGRKENGISYAAVERPRADTHIIGIWEFPNTSPI